MKSDNYWRIFIESGSTSAYVNYKKAKRAEAELLKNGIEAASEFSDFGEAENELKNRRDSN